MRKRGTTRAAPRRPEVHDYNFSALATILKAPRSKVSEWLSQYQTNRVDGPLKGYRSGRPPRLTAEQRTQLGDIIDGGPVGYGLDTGIWTSPMLSWVIEEEFDITYHPGHVRKLPHAMGFSIQRPRRILARADAAAQDRWHRRTYPILRKSPREKLGVDFHRRGEFPAGLHDACHLEPYRTSAGGAGQW